MGKRKPARLLLRWSRTRKDFAVDGPSPAGVQAALAAILGRRWPWSRSLVERLAADGYDPKTLRFQIDLREPRS